MRIRIKVIDIEAQVKTACDILRTHDFSRRPEHLGIDFENPDHTSVRWAESPSGDCKLGYAAALTCAAAGLSSGFTPDDAVQRINNRFNHSNFTRPFWVYAKQWGALPVPQAARRLLGEPNSREEAIRLLEANAWEISRQVQEEVDQLVYFVQLHWQRGRRVCVNDALWWEPKKRVDAYDQLVFTAEGLERVVTVSSGRYWEVVYPLPLPPQGREYFGKQLDFWRASSTRQTAVILGVERPIVASLRQEAAEKVARIEKILAV